MSGWPARVSGAAGPERRLVLEPFTSEQRGAPFDLTLIVFDVGRSLEATLQYNVDLFDAGTMDRLVGHFQTVLEGIVSDPGCPISSLPMLTEAERRQLLIEWNATTLDYPMASCLPSLFEAQVERSPDALALVHGDKHLTYRELNAWANQFAHYLRDRGVGPEMLVGICLERSPALVAGVLGILKAGGAYVPLDPAYPGKRLAFVLEDAGASLLLTRRRLVAGLPEHGSAPSSALTSSKRPSSESPQGMSSPGWRPATWPMCSIPRGPPGSPKGSRSSTGALSRCCAGRRTSSVPRSVRGSWPQRPSALTCRSSSCLSPCAWEVR